MAILEGAALGALRTGAASGVATDALANADAHVLGVFGSGRQAAAQIEAVCRVREIREVKVYSRRADTLSAFCREMALRLSLDVRPAADPHDAVRGSQVVTTITSSGTPVFDGDWIEPGTHVNAVGANMLIKRELDEKALMRCALIVADSREVARLEAGDLLVLIEKGLLAWGQVGELGEILAGRRPSRARREDITCFESFGMAIQDLALAAAIVERAREERVGLELPIGA